MIETIKKQIIKNRYALKYVLAAGMIVLCGVTYVIRQNSEKENGLVFETQQAANETETAVQTQPLLDASEPAAEMFYVYVCGSVCIPGVYTCVSGSRIYELIEMAGGFTQEADQSSLNLVEQVTDGMRLYVPKAGEGVESQPGGAAGVQSKVNINTATAEQLMTLPGIGTSRAEDIIAYRKKNGAFADKQDIMQVPGIKNAAYEKIKDLICV